VGAQVTFTAVGPPGPGSVAGVPPRSGTLTIHGTPPKPVPRQEVNGHPQADFSPATPTAGRHPHTPPLNSRTHCSRRREGAPPLAARAVASDLVQKVTVNPHGDPHGGQPATSPPLVTVETIQLVRNKRHRVTGILIGFSGGVNAAQAQNLAEYRLVKAGKRGS